MTYTNLDTLPAFLRSKGLTVVETPGWINRGYAGQDLTELRGYLWHHTATNRAAFANDDSPTLQMCINGRPDLAGPLCNMVFGRTGVIYMVATGVANHAGRGSAANIPTDMGNHYLAGIEMESSGVEPYDWTPEQLEVMPHFAAALEEWGLQEFPSELRLQLGHMEYSSEGKIDPAGLPGGMDGFRARINDVLDGTVETPAPAPAPAPAPETVPTAYEPDPHWEVDPGDNLQKIADWCGTDVDTLAEYNGIADKNLIKPGEWIWPPVGQGTWTVDPQDTLSKIVANYSNLTVDAVCFANGINDPNRINVGQRLQIPLS